MSSRTVGSIKVGITWLHPKGTIVEQIAYIHRKRAPSRICLLGILGLVQLALSATQDAQ